MYKYKAISKKNDKIIESRSDESVDEIIKNLEIEGYYLLDIKKSWNIKKIKKTKLNNQELYILCSKLSILLDSGLNIIEVLTSIKNSIKKKEYKIFLNNILDSLEDGNTLSESMELEEIFPTYLISIIKAGESSGELSYMLKESSKHYLTKMKIEQKIKNIIFYPMVLLGLVIITIYFFMIYIIPNFIELYDSFDTELPKMTVFLIKVSTFFTKNKMFFLLVTILMLILIFTIKNTKKWYYLKDEIKIKIPLINRVTVYNELKNFSKVMNIMLNSGFNLYSSIEVSKNVIENIIIKDDFYIALYNLKEGKTLSSTLANFNYLDDIFFGFIKIGEGSGDLRNVFQLLSEYYDNELNILLDFMLRIIEPIMLIIIGTIIGFLVISIALPMFNIIDLIL